MIIAMFDIVLDYLAKSMEERGGDSCFVHGPNGSYVRRIGNDYLLYDEDGSYADCTTDAETAMAYIGVELWRSTDCTNLDDELKVLWERFEDVPLNPETECIEEKFFIWDLGTSREDIWRFFDQWYSEGIAALI